MERLFPKGRKSDGLAVPGLTLYVLSGDFWSSDLRCLEPVASHDRAFINPAQCGKSLQSLGPPRVFVYLASSSWKDDWTFVERAACSHIGRMPAKTIACKRASPGSGNQNICWTPPSHAGHSKTKLLPSSTPHNLFLHDESHAAGPRSLMQSLGMKYCLEDAAPLDPPKEGVCEIWRLSSNSIQSHSQYQQAIVV